MNIAQISPLFESVPPKRYGGTERVVSYLTEALIKLGHQVTLFASGDSITKGKLVSHISNALHLGNDNNDPFIHYILQMQDIIERIEDFDILHFHIDYFHFPISDRFNKPHLTTLHGRQDMPHVRLITRDFQNSLWFQSLMHSGSHCQKNR